MGIEVIYFCKDYYQKGVFVEIIKKKSGLRYREKVYIHGKPKTKVFLRKTDADRWKRKVLLERDEANHFGLNPMPDMNLTQFSKMWTANRSELAKRSLDSYSSALRVYLVPLFGNLSLRSIRSHHGQELLNHLRNQNLSIARINFIIVFFKHLLNDAVKWDYLIKNPLINLKKLKNVNQNECYWMPHEVLKFLNSVKDDEHYYLYVVALNTGMRRGELLGLQWDKVNLEKRQIEISRSRDRYGLKSCTKTGKTVFVPMNDTTHRILSVLKFELRSLDYVFVDKNGKTPDLEHLSTRLFKKAVEKAGVKMIKFHNLRSTFAANFCMSGGDIYTLSKILGHSTVEMTAKRYAHLHPSYLEKAVGIITFEADSPHLAHAHLKVVQSD